MIFLPYHSALYSIACWITIYIKLFKLNFIQKNIAFYKKAIFFNIKTNWKLEQIVETLLNIRFQA